MRTLSIHALLSLLLTAATFLSGVRCDAPINLGLAAPYAILAGSTVTSTGTVGTVVTGNIGIFPGSAIVGFPPAVLNGHVDPANAASGGAQGALTTAYNEAAGKALTETLTNTDLGGKTLLPGVYKFDGAAAMNGMLTLDANGDPNAIWTFQIGSSIMIASGSSVIFKDSIGNFDYVYWQVGTTATLATGVSMVGNILALTSIVVNDGATVQGRCLARNAEVTLDRSVVTMPNSGGPTSQPSSSPTSPTSQPSSQPSTQPSMLPSAEPSAQPSQQPNSKPTSQPSSQPSKQPYTHPTARPSAQPSGKPSPHPMTIKSPSSQPSAQPSTQPSSRPSINVPPTSPVNPNAIDLGLAGPYAILAGSTVTSTGTVGTVVNGDIGIFPGSAIVGFPPAVVNGHIDSANAASGGAQGALTAAYNQAAGKALTATLTESDLGGMTLPPGVYKFDGAAAMNGMLTLNANGDPNAVWIFQIGSSLLVAGGSSVIFKDSIGNADFVYWQVGTTATLATGVPMVGNILALTSIVVNDGATVQGRCLARNAEVTLDRSVINRPPFIGPPTSQPSSSPTSPTSQPSSQPSKQPFASPSAQPSGKPSKQPLAMPSSQPSSKPSKQPYAHPTAQPSGRPSAHPNAKPSSQPSGRPTKQPVAHPSSQPSAKPFAHPSSQPTSQPSGHPTMIQPPSSQPSSQPTRQPSTRPSSQPSVKPSSSPSMKVIPQVVSLGLAAPYAILAGSTVTSTGTLGTVVTGNIGIFPGSAITGFPPAVINGQIDSANGASGSAQGDLTTAYNVLAAMPLTATLSNADLGGMTLKPGVYKFDASAAMNGMLTLDALGDSTAVWTFQVGTSLLIAGGSSVIFKDSIGNPDNVYWQVGSTATLATGVSMVGNILALTSIVVNDGATVVGRCLARNAEVTLDRSVITMPNKVSFSAVQTVSGISLDQYNADPELNAATLKESIAQTMDGVVSSDIQNFEVTAGASSAAKTLRATLSSDSIVLNYDVVVSSSMTAEELQAQLTTAVEDGSFTEYMQAAATANGATGLEDATSDTIETETITDDDAAESSSDKKTLSPGAIAGIVIGGFFGLVLIAMLIYYCACTGVETTGTHTHKASEVSMTEV